MGVEVEVTQEGKEFHISAISRRLDLDSIEP